MTTPAPGWKRLGWTLSEYARTRLRGFGDRDALLTWQMRRVEQHLAALQRISPALAERGPVEGWRSWPVTDKQWMMEHFDRLNTVGLTRDACLAAAQRADEDPDARPQVGGYAVALSAGTSGRPGLFVVSEEEQARWAGRMLGHLVPDWWREHRIAFFLRARSNLHDRDPGGRVRFEWYDLHAPLERHVERLTAQRPTILVAPPSMLRFLAEHMPSAAAGGIDPRLVVSVAEVLDPVDQRVIEARFGRVQQVYQAAEGYLGHTCALGKLHLVEDVVLVEREPVDDRRFVPIITNLWRRALPIVRYRLDDVLVAGDCTCGSPHQAIDAIEGQCDDVLQLPGLGGGTVRVFPELVRSAILSVDGITRYAARQVEPHRLEVELAIDGDRRLAERRVERELERLWRRLEATPPVMVFRPLEELPSAVKRKRVSRTF